MPDEYWDNAERGLQRGPLRLSKERESFLREYPRHHVGGDTVYELLSEVDALRVRIATLEASLADARGAQSTASRLEERVAVVAQLQRVIDDHKPYVSTTTCNASVIRVVSDLRIDIERGLHVAERRDLAEDGEST